MAKRRAETLTVLHDSPSKRCCRYLDSGDAQLHSVACTGDASPSPPPCLMPSMGSRCRKRPYHSENPSKQGNGEAVVATPDLYYKTTQCDTRKHAADVLTVQTSGSFQERRSSSISRKDEKRQRGDCACPQSGVTQVNKVADADTNAEDCSYNSFQYWRVPLPELDLSLLEDACDHSQAKDKDTSSEAMET